MLMLRGTKPWLLATVLVVVFPALAALVPQPVRAQIPEDEVGVCWDYSYSFDGAGQAQITARSNDTNGCQAGRVEFFKLQDEDVGVGAGITEPGESWYNGTLGSSIIVDACSITAKVIVANTVEDITVSGTSNAWPCTGGTARDGAIRIALQINNLQDINRDIGPFQCFAVPADGSDETYSSAIVPAISVGDLDEIPSNTLYCSLPSLPTTLEGRDYVITVIEAGDRTVASGTATVLPSETNLVQESISLQDFIDGSVGIAQVSFSGDQQNCASGTFNIPFRVFICPFIELLFSTIDFLYTGIIIPALYFAPLRTNPSEEEQTIFDVWNNFRIVANVVFIIVFLLAIFGQGLAGLQFFSAYDIRKIVPRLVIGIIMVQLSWYFVGFVIDVFNIIGASVRGIILAPVDGLGISASFDFDNTWYEIASTIGIVGAVAGTLWVGGVVMGLPMILVPIVMAMLAAFVTILIRRALLTVLVVASPLAFVLWILPNTAGLFKAWWEWFWKALLVYPLVIALLAAGELFAKVLTASNRQGAEGEQASLFVSLTALIALFVPYFFIPFVFRLAGGITALAASGLNRQGKSFSQRFSGNRLDKKSRAGQRRQKQVKSRLKRKSRLMRTFKRGQKYGADQKAKGKENAKTAAGTGNKAAERRARWRKRWGSTVGAASSAAHFAGNVSGKNQRRIGAQMMDDTRKEMMRLFRNSNDRDYIWALLGDRHPYQGDYVPKMDENGNIEKDENGNDKMVFQGNELNPAAVAAAKKDRRDQDKVQAALDIALQQVVGRSDGEGRQVMTEALLNGFLDRANESGAQGMLGIPKEQRRDNPLRRNFTRDERKDMIGRAIDFNNKHSPDGLYRDPDNGFAMTTSLPGQRRYLRRVVNRLSADYAGTGSLSEFGPSAYHGIRDVFNNVQQIYDNNVRQNGNTFNLDSITDKDERAAVRDLMIESYRIHNSIMTLKRQSQGNLEGVQALGELRHTSHAMFGREDAPTSLATEARQLSEQALQEGYEEMRRRGV